MTTPSNSIEDVELFNLRLSESACDLVEDSILEKIEALGEQLKDLKNLLEQLRNGRNKLANDGEDLPKKVTRKRGRPAKSEDDEVSKIDKNSPLQEPVVDMNNENLTPMQEGAVKIGKSLRDPFTPNDLRARLDGERTRAGNWLTAWKTRGWIETVGFGQYRKTEAFGK